MSRLVEQNFSKIIVLYGTTTGTSKHRAESIFKEISIINGVHVQIADIKDYDEENLESEDIALFVCSTWLDGKAPVSISRFMEWVDDLNNDFRVSKKHLSKIRFSVFGLGAKIYGENFCLAAQNLHRGLSSLGASSILPLVCGDDASDLEAKFDEWSANVISYLQHKRQDPDSVPPASHTSHLNNNDVEVSTFRNIADQNNARRFKDATKSSHEKVDTCSDKLTASETSCCSNKKSENHAHNEMGDCGDDAVEDEEEAEDLINAQYIDSDSDNDATVSPDGSSQPASSSLDLDLEDLGAAMKSATTSTVETDVTVIREMVTKLQRKSLVKEGYKIIGSHSAVKLCRWTKNQLRGRGGCYKHTFYGITSYQCMEATPSLACANKCVFCWRHHKNPVGKEWRWKTDEPDFIVSEAIEQHKKMINEMRGVPGVQPARLEEAFSVKHCALSLVGEPIMYPRINEMLLELHTRGISTFLVTNAQFPERISSLDPVTQLYVSVDAASKDALKAIDRPLFKDFWERFLSALRELAKKQQRTVYRMTLVKSWNMEELDGYVELIEKGQPDFIEIKAVTYCGKSDASSLTMQNVPWHREVIEYVEAIAARLEERGRGVRYSVATEHEHSCCMLLAREDKFKVDGVWHTWIDYDKYNALIQAYYESNGTATFTSTDYMAPTPSWALYKSEARGFDPVESRWRRTKTGALVEIEYKPSGSGCG